MTPAHSDVPGSPGCNCRCQCFHGCAGERVVLQYSSKYWNRRPVNRAAKDQLYSAWAAVAKALASPKRVELLDVLAQGERTVDALAHETGLTVNNTSSHLAVLKAARLVETRKAAQYVFHRLSDDAVIGVLRDIQSLTRRRHLEVDHLAQTYIDDRDALEPIGMAELRRRLKARDVTLIDVRPEAEFEAAHIAGAISVPLPELGRRLARIPKAQPVIAYCRGPYCVLSVEAVEKLRRRGYRALRLSGGLPDWKAAGLPVKAGANR